MKNTIITLILCIGCLTVSAQETTSAANDSVKAMENIIMPSFPGGVTALIEFLSNNLVYPAQAEKLAVEGRVELTFIVETDGNVSNIATKDCTISSISNAYTSTHTQVEINQTKRKCALLMAQEAARVVRSMPKWEPGRERNTDTPVRVSFTLPVTFKLH